MTLKFEKIDVFFGAKVKNDALWEVLKDLDRRITLTEACCKKEGTED